MCLNHELQVHKDHKSKSNLSKIFWEKFLFLSTQLTATNLSLKNEIFFLLNFFYDKSIFKVFFFLISYLLYISISYYTEKCHSGWWEVLNFVMFMDKHLNENSVMTILGYQRAVGTPHSVLWIQNSWPLLSRVLAEARSLFCLITRWVFHSI